VIIVDEVQESSYIYSKIRYFVRGLNCYCIFTGSYLGDVSLKKFHVAAGDTFTETLYPVNFSELLKTENLYDKFLEIDLFKRNHSNEDLEVILKVKALFEAYYKIGGYPKVLSNYLGTRNIEKSEILLNELVKNLYNELNKRVSLPVSTEMWNLALQIVVKALISNKAFNLNNMNIYNEIITDNDVFSDAESFQKTIYWLEKCGIIGSVKVSANKPYTTIGNCTKEKKFLVDLGIMRSITMSIVEDSSDFIGYFAEQYVYICLMGLRKHFENGVIETYHKVWDEKGLEEEVDFVVRTASKKVILMEVKATGGSTKSSNRILATKRADYLIKFEGAENKAFRIQKDRATLPLWGVTQLVNIVKLLDEGKIGATVSDEVFTSWVKENNCEC
jgi:predicted AAA+ superfamily ATPase